MPQESSLTQDTTMLRWRCHRGMLELDMLLLSYFDARSREFTAQQEAELEQLLTFPDPVLFSWMMGFEQSDDAKMQNLVDNIREFHQQHDTV